MKQSPLSRVENLIRRVMEEPFTWFGSGSLDPFQLATYLSRIYDQQTVDNQPVPNQFTLYICPDDYHAIESEIPLLKKQVSDYVILLTGRRGIHLSDTPSIQFEMDVNGKPNSARIVASHEHPLKHIETAVYPAEMMDPTREAIRETDAFLILSGRQHILLDRPIILIGRRTDNDIVLDSPSISRQHAQIRWRQRYFVLYDVSSHGLTFVNGEAVQEHILRPGDVIALSDILFVYGEGREDAHSTPKAADNDEMDSTMLKPDL